MSCTVDVYSRFGPGGGTEGSEDRLSDERLVVALPDGTPAVARRAARQQVGQPHLGHSVVITIASSYRSATSNHIH